MHLKHNVMKALIKWPNWYFAGALAMLFLISVEIAVPWMAWGYLFGGFIIWAAKKVSDEV
jgi:hypothetical protein